MGGEEEVERGEEGGAAAGTLTWQASHSAQQMDKGGTGLSWRVVGQADVNTRHCSDRNFIIEILSWNHLSYRSQMRLGATCKSRVPTPHPKKWGWGREGGREEGGGGGAETLTRQS